MVFSLERKSDEALMKLLSRGREEAFDILFRRHFQRLVSFFFRSLCDGELSKDLAQEVFLKVFRASATYEEKAKFTTWLYTIARNTLLNHLRKEKKSEHTVNGTIREESLFEHRVKRQPSTLPDPSEIAQAKELGETIEKALLRLPESLKTPFVMAQVSGLSYREISDVLGISQGAVKLRVFRAREIIVEHLEDIDLKPA